MTKENYIFGIALADYEASAEELASVSKEYDLTEEQAKELKPAYLFRLSDNTQYWQYDADFVFWSENSESYYHTGNSSVIGKQENDKIVALVDENAECMAI